MAAASRRVASRLRRPRRQRRAAAIDEYPDQRRLHLQRRAIGHLGQPLRARQAQRRLPGGDQMQGIQIAGGQEQQTAMAALFARAAQQAGRQAGGQRRQGQRAFDVVRNQAALRRQQDGRSGPIGQQVGQRLHRRRPSRQIQQPPVRQRVCQRGVDLLFHPAPPRVRQPDQAMERRPGRRGQRQLQAAGPMPQPLALPPLPGQASAPCRLAGGVAQPAAAVGDISAVVPQTFEMAMTRRQPAQTPLVRAQFRQRLQLHRQMVGQTVAIAAGIRQQRGQQLLHHHASPIRHPGTSLCFFDAENANWISGSRR
ncbi:hypothetical protein MY55_11320 [Chromobacterium subtsugae]|nr:hypothetical protein MY55_11320 [Chromobacterium subtsugae]